MGNETFWIDHAYDRERAGATDLAKGSGGSGSRYADTVRRHVGEFDAAFGDIAPVTFACTAWRLATPPSLDPGLVRWHPRIVSATCERNQWDGTLIARLVVVSRWPAELTVSREWTRDRGWRDWPQTFGQYLRPTDHDLVRSPHLRACLLVDAPVPHEDLPPAPDGPSGDVESTALRAVTVLVRELNELLKPMLGHLDASPH